MADDPRVVRGGGEVFGGSRQVVPSDGVGCAARRSRKSWMSGWRAWPASSLSSPSSGQWWSAAAASARRSGSRRSRVGACLIAVDGAEPGEQRLPGGEVHQAPGAIEVAARPVGAADGRHREPDRVRWRCTAVSNAAVAGSGMIRATRRPSSSGGGSASSTAYISAQNPPASGTGGTDHAMAGRFVCAAQRGEQAVGGRVAGRDHAAPDVSRRGERRRGG